MPAATWPKAAIENHRSTTAWNATSTYWNALVVSIPRYEIQAARATNTRHVATLTGTLRVSSAMASLPVIWARAR